MEPYDLGMRASLGREQRGADAASVPVAHAMGRLTEFDAGVEVNPGNSTRSWPGAGR